MSPHDVVTPLPDGREEKPPADETVPAGAPPASAPPPQVIVVPVVVPVVVAPVIIAAPLPAPTEDFQSAGTEREKSPIPEKNARSQMPAEPFSAGAGESPRLLFRAWRKVGGTGMVVSFFLHCVIFAFAALWIVVEWTSPAEAETMFVSGSGGGRAERAGRAGTDRRFSPERNAASERMRVASLSERARVVLPPLPKNVLKQAVPAAAESFSGGSVGGAGTGFGGGIGAGLGVGIGGGKNHLGKFKTLLGAKIQAKRIAVYLDCSGSMKSYLPAVKAEIYEKFPDADIFSYSGAQTEIHDGEIVGGKTFKAKAQRASSRRRAAEDETDVGRLSSQGRAIYKKYAAHFAAGTAGAWLDILSRERYDALVVFSDFRDGVRQRRAGKTIFADSAYSPVADGRDARERRWENDWLAAFSRKSAPRLYLFSVRAPPQEFLRKCAEVSGGETTQLSLKKGKSAPETP